VNGQLKSKESNDGEAREGRKVIELKRSIDGNWNSYLRRAH
jgi:hypothetical protein